MSIFITIGQCEQNFSGQVGEEKKPSGVLPPAHTKAPLPSIDTVLGHLFLTQQPPCDGGWLVSNKKNNFLAKHFKRCSKTIICFT